MIGLFFPFRFPGTTTSTGTGTSDHSALYHLDYATSGHIGFASSTALTSLSTTVGYNTTHRTTTTGNPHSVTAADIGVEAGAEVNNISDANATDLTDSGDSSLHYHSADRNRANHTGTQTAATISDFDTEVANNSAVTANTAKVTNATHTGEVTGNTTLTIANNVVDEANLKLDTAPTNGYVLTADDTASGGMKWAYVTTSGGGGTTDHSALSNLDFTNSGHTGFASSSDLTSTSGSLQTQIDNKEPADATILKDADIGSTVCSYTDSRLSDSRTPTSHGNEAHSSTFITSSSVTYETLSSNGDVGSSASTLCAGNDSRLSDARTPTSHNNTYHSETYITSAGVTYEALNSNSDVGTGSSQVAAGNHSHTSFTTLSVTSSLTASEKIVIPLNQPTTLENGCIWIA